MSDHDPFDLLLDHLLENAVKDFRSTEEYLLLREKLDLMDHDCDTMLTEEEKRFAVECFELLLDAGGREQRYVYQRGLSDGVRLLKRLGALA